MYYPATFGNEKMDVAHAVHRIVNAVQPERIFYKGRCFFIVLAARQQKPFAEYKACVDATGILPFYQYTLCPAGELEVFLTQGHFFYSTLCTKENMVYDSGTTPLPLPLFQRMETIQNKALHDFAVGHHRARWFLKGATFFIANEENGLAAFLLHQAAEQVMRTMALVLRGEAIKTHNLTELKQHLTKYAVSIEDLLPATTEKERFLLDRLEKAYSCSRYTDCYTLEAETAMELLQVVRKLLMGIEKLFGDMLGQFTESKRPSKIVYHET